MTMTATHQRGSGSDDALTAAARAVWSLGDYPRLAAEVIPELGHVLVAATGTGPGGRVLDVAAGSGNAALQAARTGADVVAADLTPDLLEHGRAAADAEGLRGIDWRVCDAESLPFEDAAFDVVMSCVGAMFAPHHQVVADEMLRVTRPGGVVGMVNWTPDGFIGQMFATMRPFAAPPAPGAQPPPLWGQESHVADLFGDRVADLSTTRRFLTVDRFDSGESFRDYFKAYYGPTIATYRRHTDDPERTRELDLALADLGRRHLHEGVMAWEYLLVTATKR